MEQALVPGPHGQTGHQGPEWFAPPILELYECFLFVSLFFQSRFRHPNFLGFAFWVECEVHTRQLCAPSP